MVAVAGFCLLILGVRWALIDARGLNLPSGDQWEALGQPIFQRDAEGTLLWTDFLTPYHQHRIALTRLLEWGLVRLNGQWDARLEMAVNATLHTVLFALLFLVGSRVSRGWWRAAWLALLLLLGALPFSVPTTLNGMGSAASFLALGAFGYLWLTLSAERWGWRWILAQALGAVALLATDAGATAGLTVVVILGLQMACARRGTVLHLAGLAIGLVFTVLGCTATAHLAADGNLLPAILLARLHGFTLGLSWPAIGLWPASVLLSAPALLLTVRRWRQGGLPPYDAAIVALALWALLQYAGAGGSAPPALAPGAVDWLGLGVAAQFLALVRLQTELLGTQSPSRPTPSFRPQLTALWFCTIAIALGHEARVQVRHHFGSIDARPASRIPGVSAYPNSPDTRFVPPALAPAPPPSGAMQLMQRREIPELAELQPVGAHPAFVLTPAPGFAPSASAQLPPGLAAPPAPVAFSFYNSGSPRVWRSNPQPPHAATMLRLWIAGDLAAGRTDLRLTVCSSSLRVAVLPDAAPGLRWKTLNIPRPEGAWWIEAEGYSGAGWFAFTAPVPLGRWSWLTGKFLRFGPVLAWIGALLLLAAAVAGLRQHPPSIERIKKFWSLPPAATRFLPYLALAALVYFPLFAHLDRLPIRVWDEARLATNALEMLQDRDLLVTHFDGAPDLWNTKPPLLIWTQAFFMSVLGVSEVSFRLPSALAALLTGGALLWFSLRYLRQFWFGFIAVMVLVTSFGYINIHGAMSGDYDTVLTLLTTASGLFLFAFLETRRHRFLHFFFVTLALAVLTKGVAGLLFAPAMLAYILWKGRWRELLREKHFYLGLAAFLLLTVGYYWLRETRNPGYLRAVADNELGGRFLNVLEEHRAGFWYYHQNFIKPHLTPWYLLVPVGLVVAICSPHPRLRRLNAYCLLMAVVYFVIISTAKTKLWWYDLPLYPYLAVIISTALHFGFELVRYSAWTRSPRVRATVAIMLLGAVFALPYRNILYKTAHPGEFTGDDAYYEIGYFLKDALAGKHDLNGSFLLLEGYNPHNRFYITMLNRRGVAIAFKDWRDLEAGDKVIACQKNIVEYVVANYVCELPISTGGIFQCRILGHR